MVVWRLRHAQVRIARTAESHVTEILCRAMTEASQDIFQCGVSVAPVTDWRFYDSVYTERYMGRPGPGGNYAGYDASQCPRRASILAHSQSGSPSLLADGGLGRRPLKRLLLVHGTADDNVHLQHTMAMTSALASAGVNFEQMVKDKYKIEVIVSAIFFQIYPDARHSLSHVQPHFYLLMEDFLSKCFSDAIREDGVEDFFNG